METIPPFSSFSSNEHDTQPPPIWQQQTMPLPAIIDASVVTQPLNSTWAQKKRIIVRTIAMACICIILLTIYLVWHSEAAQPATTAAQVSIQQSPTTAPNSPTAIPANSTNETNTRIHVYVVGAIKHPGVYMLAADARVYDLLRAAGGTQPGANLVGLNLAARLSDGQEVYVTMLDETPPGYVGGVPEPGGSTQPGGAITPSSSSASQQVNINTAGADELRQQLHISAKTAQSIVAYRLQHGPFTSVDQLLQVTSKAIYQKIKDMVTV